MSEKLSVDEKPFTGDNKAVESGAKIAAAAAVSADADAAAKAGSSRTRSN